MPEERERTANEGRSVGTPLLEWIFACLGLLVVAGFLGAIGWQAWGGREGQLPVLVTRVDKILPQAGDWLVEVTVVNRGSRTAANVQVEAALRGPEGVLERSSVVFDYVPSRSQRTGGLLFDSDPRGEALEVRAVGWTDP